MLERKEVFLLNGEVIELDLVDGRYYGVVLENGSSYVYKYLASEIDVDSITTASSIADLDNNILCMTENEFEELKVSDNSRIDNIVELPKFIGDYIMNPNFWKTNIVEQVKTDDDKIDMSRKEEAFVPQNFVEAIYAKQKGWI